MQTSTQCPAPATSKIADTRPEGAMNKVAGDCLCTVLPGKAVGRAEAASCGVTTEPSPFSAAKARPVPTMWSIDTFCQFRRPVLEVPS